MKPLRDLNRVEMDRIQGGHYTGGGWHWHGGGGGGGDPFLNIRLFFEDFFSLFLRVNL